MNKKVNTGIFILAASLLNIVIMIAIFVLVLSLLGMILPEDTSATVGQFILLFTFLGSIAGTYGIYSLIIKFISNKYDMDQYFHPIFKPKKKR